MLEELKHENNTYNIQNIEELARLLICSVMSQCSLSTDDIGFFEMCAEWGALPTFFNSKPQNKKLRVNS